MVKTILFILVIWAAIVANMPLHTVGGGLKPLPTQEKVAAIGPALGWESRAGNP
ncbi:MAG TPA: hypothetical protein VGB77_16875 [Abditibacteriaceae bacterium]|jgi:hypothetical protein